MWTVFENGVVPGQTPGETVESVAARAASVLRDLMPTLENSNVALVAHGHYLRILATVFLRTEVRMAAKTAARRRVDQHPRVGARAAGDPHLEPEVPVALTATW